MPLGRDVDLAAVAASTPGMVGADLASLANEAALAAAARRRAEVRRRDFDAALSRILLGTERKVVLSARDRERTAYHESGHALANMLSPNGDPVRTISIIRRGAALGVTFSAPDADRYSYGREELRTKIRVALGGRAAEELVYGEIAAGAESDIDQLTRLARHMVGRWGMSDTIGPVAVVPADGQLVLPGGGASDRRRGICRSQRPAAPASRSAGGADGGATGHGDARRADRVRGRSRERICVDVERAARAAAREIGRQVGFRASSRNSLRNASASGGYVKSIRVVVLSRAAHRASAVSTSCCLATFSACSSSVVRTRPSTFSSPMMCTSPSVSCM